jgi:hypothetical protein
MPGEAAEFGFPRPILLLPAEPLQFRPDFGVLLE